MHIEPGTPDDLREFYIRHHGRLGCDFDALHNALSGWNIYTLDDDGKCAVIVERNGEAHVSGYKNQRVGLVRLRFALDALRITKTDVMNTFKPGHALARRLGFVLDRKNDEVTNYVRTLL